jgi:hypothetical protein
MLLIDEFPVMEVGDMANHEHPIAFVYDYVHVSACAQLFLHHLTPSTDVCVTNTGLPEEVILN